MSSRHFIPWCPRRAAVVPVTIIWSLLGCASVPGHREPIGADRPNFTEGAETVPAGAIQAEGGYTYAHHGAEHESSVGEVLVRVGAGERAELRFDLSSYQFVSQGTEREDGMEDAGIGAKFRVLDGSEHARSWRPAVAVVAGTTLPTGATAFGDRALRPEAKLAAAWELSERTSFGANVGYAWESEEDERFGQTIVSASLGYALSSRLGSYIEGFAFSPERRDGPFMPYANGGLSYLINDDFQVDLRAGVGRRAEGRSNYFFGAGLARRW